MAIISIAFSPVYSQNIRLNQIGYYPSAQKLAAVPGNENGTFSIINKQDGQTVYSSTLSSPQYWDASGESISFADFSSFTDPGTYYIKTNSQTSHEFEIKTNKIYDELAKWVAKGMYLWRASTEIESKYSTFKGTSYARAAGHTDNNVIIHSSAATPQRPTGTVVSAPKGWYDAGDYNMYVVNAGVSVFHMAHAYELYPEYFASQNLNIPESGNNTPDILDEIKWEMDWLLAMQDLDGGVYFKLTSKWFSSYVMPANDNLERYMVGKSTTSALDFAAMTAMAYRLFKNSTDYPGFADQCLSASKKAWQWAKANPSVTFTNPSDISTGAYGDTYLGDEFLWAAAELFISTKEQTYYNELNFSIDFLSPQWHYVAGNGIMSLALHKDELPSFVNKNLIASKFSAFANSIYNLYSQSPYKIPMTDFYWGSNGDMAGKSAVLASAYKILNDPKFKTASMEGLNYLLGRNAVGYCFVSGFGDKHPVDLHDRRSQSDGIQASLPGYLAGGPNTDAQVDCGASAYPSSNYKAKSYLDKDCSYSTNEIAINWNAPLLALLAMTEAQNTSEETLTVEIETPAENAEYCKGTDIVIKANANTTSGTINSVRFYAGPSLLSSDDSEPYSFTWSNAHAGQHTLKVIATSTSGGTESASVNITINEIPAAPIVTSPVSYIRGKETEQLSAQGVNLLWYYMPNGTGSATAPTPSSAIIGETSYYVTQTLKSCESPQAEIIAAITPDNIDCAGTVNGTAEFDACGVCSGGTTGRPSCSEQEAETGTLFQGTTENAISGYSGPGYVNAQNKAGSYFTFAITAGRNITTYISIRYAHNAASGCPASVWVNDTEQKPYVDFPATSSFTDWDTLSIEVNLSEGINYITLSSINESGLANIDKIWYNNHDLAFNEIVSQNITLSQGWNIISTFVIPRYNSIPLLFNGLDLRTIKSESAFWQANQPNYLNSLNTLTAGDGYLAYMNTEGTATVVGVPMDETQNTANQQSGWSLTGCPYPAPSLFSNNLNTSNCQVIKNFEGFWQPDGGQNSIDSFVPGKGYFIKK